MRCDYCGYERGATVTAGCPHCGAPAPKSQGTEIETYISFDPGSNGYVRRVSPLLRERIAGAGTNAEAARFAAMAAVQAMGFPKG